CGGGSMAAIGSSWLPRIPRSSRQWSSRWSARRSNCPPPLPSYSSAPPLRGRSSRSSPRSGRRWGDQFGGGRLSPGLRLGGRDRRRKGTEAEILNVRVLTPHLTHSLRVDLHDGARTLAHQLTERTVGHRTAVVLQPAAFPGPVDRQEEALVLDRPRAAEHVP